MGTSARCLVLRGKVQLKEEGISAEDIGSTRGWNPSWRGKRSGGCGRVTDNILEIPLESQQSR